jgi:NAD(P)H-flavin reductase
MEFKAEVYDMRTYADKRASPEPHTRIYKLKIPDGINLDFKSGQFMMLAMDDFSLRGNPKMLKWSSYSIASSQLTTEYLEFSIRLLDTPGFTHHLKDCCQIGIKLNVKGPYGTFTVKPDAKRLMYVCTGTGVAPLLSHIRTLLHGGSAIPISLFFGFKNPDVYIFKEELEELAKKYANFKLEPTITDAGREDWAGRVGIFHDFFPTYPFEARAETDVYLCGNPKMVDDLKMMLPTLGFKAENIHIEPW